MLLNKIFDVKKDIRMFTDRYYILINDLSKLKCNLTQY